MHCDNSKKVLQKPKIIAIDGPAGAGKSTIAKRLAKKLKFSYLDTGAMYRALTFKALRENVELDNEKAIVALAQQTHIDYGESGDGIKVLLDGEDVSQLIRTLEVTNNTYQIAQKPDVRGIMVEWQREIGAKKSVVIEGRDIGTVVFPQADYKFYLDATVEERCQRRIKELREKGEVVDEDQLKKEIVARDTRDKTREVGPLKKADDAILINSTSLTIEQVVEKIAENIEF